MVGVLRGPFPQSFFSRSPIGVDHFTEPSATLTAMTDSFVSSAPIV